MRAKKPLNKVEIQGAAKIENGYNDHAYLLTKVLVNIIAGEGCITADVAVSVLQAELRQRSRQGSG